LRTQIDDASSWRFLLHRGSGGSSKSGVSVVVAGPCVGAATPGVVVSLQPMAANKAADSSRVLRASCFIIAVSPSPARRWMTTRLFLSSLRERIATSVPRVRERASGGDVAARATAERDALPLVPARALVARRHE
jgi:hypothetical protein